MSGGGMEHRHLSALSYRLRNEGLYGVGAFGQGAADRAVGGTEYRAGLELDLVVFPYLPICLHQHVLDAVVGDMSAVLLDAEVTYQRDRELIRVLVLPTRNFRQEFGAVVALGASKDQHHRLAGC